MAQHTTLLAGRGKEIENSFGEARKLLFGALPNTTKRSVAPTWRVRTKPFKRACQRGCKKSSRLSHSQWRRTHANPQWRDGHRRDSETFEAIRPRRADYRNRRASRSDSSRARRSPSRTGPLTLRMMERLASSRNSTRTWVIPPREPVRPMILETLPSLTGWSYTVSEACKEAKG